MRNELAISCAWLRGLVRAAALCGECDRTRRRANRDAAGVRRQMANRKKPLVVVTRKLPDSVETRMRELFDARLNLDDAPMTPAQLAEATRSAEILVPTVTDLVSGELLQSPDCKLR